MGEEKPSEQKEQVVLDVRARRVGLDDTITVREAERLISVDNNRNCRYVVSVDNVSDGSDRNSYALDNACKIMKKLIEEVRGKQIPREVRLTYTFDPASEEQP
jgi:hypothetical protein